MSEAGQPRIALVTGATRGIGAAIAAVVAAWFACGLNKKQYDREGHLIDGAEAKSET